MAEVPQIAFVPRDTRRLRLVARQLDDPELIVGGQAVEPPPPAGLALRAAASTDDGRLDDELFPSPGRPQRAGHDGFLVGVDRRVRRVGRRVGIVRLVAGGKKFAEDLVARRHRIGRARSLGDPRDLAERKIFVEPLGGQPVDGRRQQGDERAAGRIGAPRAAIEVRGDAATRAGVLE